MISYQQMEVVPIPVQLIYLHDVLVYSYVNNVNQSNLDIFLFGIKNVHVRV